MFSFTSLINFFNKLNETLYEVNSSKQFQPRLILGVLVALIVFFSGCQKDYLLPTPNQFSKDEAILKPRTPTIKIEDVKKWFGEQTALGFAANNGEDSSLFHAMPKWELANNAFNKIGAEYVSVPLGLDLKGGIIVPRLLVRRSSNGGFVGRYVIYLPTDEYHNRVQGQYNPSNFTGSVIYTDFKGNYSHGYKIEDGEWVGTAVAKKDDGREGVPSGLRSCTYTTYCINIQVSPNQDAPLYLECFSIVTCTSLCGPAVYNCFLEQDPWGTDEYGGGTGGYSGGGYGSWSSSQPTFYLGQLTDQARDFLTIKGFSQIEIDFLSFSPAIVNQIFSYLSINDSVDALRFCHLHLNLCIENSDYWLANIQQQPELGTEAWVDALWTGVPGWGNLNLAEKSLAVLNPIEAFQYRSQSLLAINEAQAFAVRRLGASGALNRNSTPGNDRDKVNAFQHSYWNALLTLKMGRDRAKVWTDAHEWGLPNVPDMNFATQMDLFNNHIGRDIGHSWLTFSGISLIQAVEDSLNNGMMQFICFDSFNANNADGYKFINQRLIFTNQIC